VQVRVAGSFGSGVALRGRQHDRDVADAFGHRPGGILIGGDRDHAVAADAADRRLDAGEHVLIRRAQHRTGCFSADIAGPEIRRGADAGARSAGAQRRTAVEGRVARILARIVRVVTLSTDRVVSCRHRRRRAGDPVGQLGHPGFGDDDRAGVPEVFRERRFVRRHEMLERQRAAGGPHVSRVDVVFERDRNAVQRAAHLALRALAVALVGELERIRIHRNRGVEPILVGSDTHQVLLHQLPRRDASLLHRGAHVGNRRFDDVKDLDAGAEAFVAFVCACVARVAEASKVALSEVVACAEC
jgi:hypothetical protein